MEILGPSQIALTMNTYARVIQELRRNAAERIEASSNPLAIIRRAGRMASPGGWRGQPMLGLPILPEELHAGSALGRSQGV
jgi:hypothetical protein